MGLKVLYAAPALLVVACSNAGGTDEREHRATGNSPPTIAEEPEGEGPPPDGGVPDAPKPQAEYVAIAGGTQFACARMNDGTVRCWGGGASTDTSTYADGALGLPGPESCAQSPGCPSRACARSPAKVSGLSNVSDLSTASYSACAVIADGSVQCWGSNEFGMFGLGLGESLVVRPKAVPGLSSVRQIVLGNDDSACALIADGTVKCWGNNADGQLGFESSESCYIAVQPCTLSPTTVPGLDDVARLSIDTFLGNSVCALRRDGTVKCWGFAGFDGPANLDAACKSAAELCAIPPTTMPGLANIIELAGAGAGGGCALRNDGAVLCWGSDHLPQRVPGLPLPATHIERQGGVGCARLTDGRVMCWGPRTMLGIPLSATPIEIPELKTSTQFTLPPGGFGDVCYVGSDRAPHCARQSNCVGQRGDGTNEACNCEEG